MAKTQEELAKLNEIPGLEAIGPYPYVGKFHNINESLTSGGKNNPNM